MILYFVFRSLEVAKLLDRRSLVKVILKARSCCVYTLYLVELSEKPTLSDVQEMLLMHLYIQLPNKNHMTADLVLSIKLEQ